MKKVLVVTYNTVENFEPGSHTGVGGDVTILKIFFGKTVDGKRTYRTVSRNYVYEIVKTALGSGEYTDVYIYLGDFLAADSPTYIVFDSAMLVALYTEGLSIHLVGCRCVWRFKKEYCCTHQGIELLECEHGGEKNLARSLRRFSVAEQRSFV